VARLDVCQFGDPWEIQKLITFNPPDVRTQKKKHERLEEKKTSTGQEQKKRETTEGKNAKPFFSGWVFGVWDMHVKERKGGEGSLKTKRGEHQTWEPTLLLSGVPLGSWEGKEWPKYLGKGGTL